jgi:hypothetical protein
MDSLRYILSQNIFTKKTDRIKPLGANLSNNNLGLGYFQRQQNKDY